MNLLRNILRAPFVLCIRVPAVLVITMFISVGAFFEKHAWTLDNILPGFER